MGRWVADRPMRVIGDSDREQRRSTDRLRCEPRLFPATACSSSRIRVRAPRSAFLPLSDVSRM